MLSTELAGARDTLARAVERVTGLLRSSPDPKAPAVGNWNVGEVAMHLSQVWMAVPGLAHADLSGMSVIHPDLAGTAGGSLVRDIWDLGEATMLGVKSDPERDPAVLAGRIAAQAERYLADTAGVDPEEKRPWLVEGATVTAQTLTCHLLSETIMHGDDIARAAGRPWPIDRTDAAIVLCGFMVPVLRALDPAAMVDREHAIDATYDVRVRGSASYHFVFEGGQLHVEDPASRRIDCHISAEPATLLALMWGRRSQWRAIARGELMAWGRKPWLGPRLRGMLRNP
jgi:uncharacterized protein (TIGR03083 family)